MSALIRQHYNRGWLAAIQFYIDRVLRLYPQFICFFSLTLLLNHHLHFKELSQTLPVWCVIGLNGFLLDLNWLMLFPRLVGSLFIPAAWSLGAESKFYLLAPLTNRWPVVEKLLIIGSLSIFSLAIFQVIDIEIYGYRLILGTLWIFLAGTMLDEHLNGDPRGSTCAYWLVGLHSAATIILVVASALGRFLARPSAHTAELVFGVVCGLPIVGMLATRKSSTFDAWAGGASYGMFLSHGLVLMIFQHYGWLTGKHYGWPHGSEFVNHWLPVFISMPIGLAGYFLVERPFIYLRHQRRKELSAGIPEQWGGGGWLAHRKSEKGAG